MSVRWYDSFDHYSTGQFLAVGYSAGADGTINASGRNGSCYKGSNQSLNVALDNRDTWMLGGAFKTDQTGSASQPGWVAFYDGATRQIGIDVFNTGTGMRLRAYRGTGTLLQSGNTVILPNTWYHVAIKVVIANSGGRVIVKLNNQPEIDFTGDTQETANAYVNSISFGAIPDGSGTSVDDLWIMDTAGSVNNDMPADPDLRARANLPNANGNYSQMLGSDGNSTDNYLLVDDPTSIDSDTTYVGTSTAGQLDTYGFADVPTNTTVIAVQQVGVFRKDDAGSRTARLVARVGSTDYESGNLTVLDSYSTGRQIRETNPATSAAWTPTEVNALEAGVKLQA